MDMGESLFRALITVRLELKDAFRPADSDCLHNGLNCPFFSDDPGWPSQRLLLDDE